MQVGELQVDLSLDLGDFAPKLKALEEQLKGIENQFSGFATVGDKLANVGKGLTVGVTLPLGAAGVAATKMAMDVVESENLVAVSFGDMADSAREWSRSLSDSVGLNEYALRQQAGTFNTMFKSMGLGKQAAFDMATGLTQLAYDMASFYNLKPEEAFEKLRAGISGEAEPLKQLGILVDDNTVKTWAYKNGIAAQGAELTEHQKVLARYGAIMEQTSLAQGDLARTAESPTNQLRIMSSRLQEAAVNLGNVLLPAVTPVIKGLADFAKWLGELDPVTLKWGVAIAGVAAAVGPLLFGVGKLLAMVPAMVQGFQMIQSAGSIIGGLFSAITSPVGIAVAAIAGVATVAAVVYKNWDQISTWFSNVWATMAYNVQKAWLGIENAIAQALAGVMDKVAPVAKWLPDALGGKAFENAHKAIDAFADRTEAAMAKLTPPVMKHVDNTVKLENATVRATDALQYQTKVTDENASSTENAAKSKQTVADVLAELEGKLAAATQNEAALGDRYDEAAEKAKAVESAITSLTEMGLKASDPVIQDLVAKWKDYNAQVDKANQLAEEAKKAKSVQDVLANLSAELEKATNKGEVFGEAFDEQEAKIQATQRALERLIDLGLDPASAEVLYVKERLDELKAAQAAQAQAADDAAKREAGAAAYAKQVELDRWSAIQAKLDETAKAEEAAANVAKAAELARGEALQALYDKQKAVTDVVNQADQAVQKATITAGIFGDQNDLAKQKVDIFRKAIQDLVDLGLKPGDPALDAMTNKLKAAQAEMDNTSTRSRTLQEVMSNAFLTMAGSADQLSRNIVGFFDAVGSGQKDFKSAMKEALLATVSGLEQQVIAAQLAAAGWAAAASIWTFGASLAALGAAMPQILAALAGFELVKAAIRAMATGGVVTGPTLALVGEAGPEAVVPLDRWDEFQDNGDGGSQTIIVELDGREIARTTVRHMPGVLRLQGVTA